MRGVAILGVICAHVVDVFFTKYDYINQTLQLGRFGVQLFFYVSALSMCYMWQKRSGEAHATKKFYARRILRIAPLYWLAIPLYLYLSDKVIYASSINIGNIDVLLNLLLLHGFSPTAISTNTLNTVVPGGWSIAVEVTFYIIFPFVIQLIRDDKKYYLILALIAWMLNCLYAEEYFKNILILQTGLDKKLIEDYLYYYFLNQAPIFLLGCYLFYARLNQISKSEYFIIILWIFLILFVKFFLHLSIAFVVIFLLIGLFSWACLRLGICNKLVDKLGEKSYSIYLIHFAVIDLLAYLFPLDRGTAKLFLMILLTIFISYLIALPISLFIEKPISRVATYLTGRKSF